MSFCARGLMMLCLEMFEFVVKGRLGDVFVFCSRG